MIPLGLEPKTYCLEGSCSIQLSYGTNLDDYLFRKSAAKVDIFSETAKLFREILQRINAWSLFCSLPVAIDDFAVSRILVDLDAKITRVTTYIEVLVVIRNTIHFYALG